MKYFIDTEFHEYQKKPLIGKPIDTIELISIGIVSEEKTRLLGNEAFNNGKGVEISDEYYAICKEFDLKAAWNNKWLRENVLISVHKDLCSMVGTYGKTYHWKLFEDFTYKSMRNLLNWYGKTKKQIAEEIREFVYSTEDSSTYKKEEDIITVDICKVKPEFYAYYADYDWVVFCWLFGRMIDLPKGFPMYCRDLKQMLDETVAKKSFWKRSGITENNTSLEEKMKIIESLAHYPKQTNEHNALADAKWNYELYKFLNTL